ncbi:hypothetical protein PybrP1_001248 [[Pythium] brassicae (nom. inval.)]|nr:hypothetical protein PybrP1_001248 [[Pythium] brassicae (nom. inval.)]
MLRAAALPAPPRLHPLHQRSPAALVRVRHFTFGSSSSNSNGPAPDSTRRVHETPVVMATGGAISSASACVFFGAKLLCDRVVTDIVSLRAIGDKVDGRFADEFVRISVLGAVRKQSFTVEPSDIKLLEHDGKHAYKFQVGERELALDTTSAAAGFNQRALEILLQGKPLVTRKGKQSKKPRV